MKQIFKRWQLSALQKSPVFVSCSMVHTFGTICFGIPMALSFFPGFGPKIGSWAWTSHFTSVSCEMLLFASPLQAANKTTDDKNYSLLLLILSPHTRNPALPWGQVHATIQQKFPSSFSPFSYPYFQCYLQPAPFSIATGMILCQFPGDGRVTKGQVRRK